MGLLLGSQEKLLGNYLCELPMQHCVPIYFGNPSRIDSKINNGTATLLKKSGKLFVVTNHHVLEEYFTRVAKEDGIQLQIGGCRITDIGNHIVLNEQSIDVCVMEFTGHNEAEFRMEGNVPTIFYEVGELEPSLNKGKVVAFGGYPGVFRIREELRHVNFHTMSSGASIVHEISDKNIIVSIDHNEESITHLSSTAPPPNIRGVSGGPVFEINSSGRFMTIRFSGIVSECSENLQVMFAKPVGLFATALS